jgi:hypothetical protein
VIGNLEKLPRTNLSKRLMERTKNTVFNSVLKTLWPWMIKKSKSSQTFTGVRKGSILSLMLFNMLMDVKMRVTTVCLFIYIFIYL